MLFLDELHRSGASEWSRKLQKLVDYQHDNPNFHMLGITATEERDMDGKDMAEFLGKIL